MVEDDEVVERRRFMAVCWGPGDPATTLAMLDDAGQLSDILFAGQLSGLIRHSREDLFFDQSKVGTTAAQQPCSSHCGLKALET